MSRIIFYLFLLGLIYWVIKRAFSPRKGVAGKSDEKSEELVKDPFCECYIPKSQSYAVSLEGKKFFFCSEECYRKYQASRALPKS